MATSDNNFITKSETRNQQTIEREVSLQGQGLHNGKQVEIELKPLPPNSGINFTRVGGKKPEWVKAIPVNVISTRRGVELGSSTGEKEPQESQNQLTFMTVEHLMAVCAGLNIDNLLVEVEGGEIPSGDGSAGHLVELIEKAGRREQNERGKPFTPNQEIKLQENDSQITIKPAAELSYHYELDYDQNPPGKQKVSFYPVRQNFAQEIAPARTFILKREIAAIKKAGLGQGGSRENVVVYSRDGVEGELRFPEEAARHKLLDLMGDLYLAGPLRAEVYAVKSGHTLNHRAARKISDLKQKEDTNE